jgi:hypothetical protein
MAISQDDNRISKKFFIEIEQKDNLHYVFPCGQGQYRATAQIRQGGAPFKDNCDITIYGLGLETLRQLSYLLANPLIEFNKRNKVKIWVGGDFRNNQITGGDLAFQAESYFAAADFTTAPNIAFRIVGAVGYFEDYKSAGTAYKIERGSKVGQVFNYIVKQMNWNSVIFSGESKNEIENKVLDTCYLESPTWLQRARELADMFNYQIRFSNYDIIIAKYGENLFDEATKEISAENGLISYPTFTSDGISFRAIYNNDIKVGSKIKVKSVVPFLSGNEKRENTYVVGEKITTLSSEPNGQWQTEYRAFYAQGAVFNSL